MDSTVKVTIGMPVYNAEKYVASAIQSVLNQSYTNFELIISNDGSTDGSWEIVQTFTDPRIKLVNAIENKGIAFRLNEQINMATGTYFARMDADDIMFKDRIERQVHFMQQNENVDVVGSQAISIDENDVIKGLRSLKQSAISFFSVFKSNFIHPTILAKLSWYKKNQYDIHLSGAEDFDLFFRTRPVSHFHNLNEPLLFYRDVSILDIELYVQRQKKLIAALRKNKTKINSHIAFSIMVLLVLSKIIVARLIHYFGHSNYLVAKRDQLLPTDDIKKYITILLDSKIV